MQYKEITLFGLPWMVPQISERVVDYASLTLKDMHFPHFNQSNRSGGDYSRSILKGISDDEIRDKVVVDVCSGRNTDMHAIAGKAKQLLRVDISYDEHTIGWLRTHTKDSNVEYIHSSVFNLEKLRSNSADIVTELYGATSYLEGILFSLSAEVIGKSQTISKPAYDNSFSLDSLPAHLQRETDAERYGAQERLFLYFKQFAEKLRITKEGGQLILASLNFDKSSRAHDLFLVPSLKRMKSEGILDYISEPFEDPGLGIHGERFLITKLKAIEDKLG